jgi:hypothetical protein
LRVIGAELGQFITYECCRQPVDQDSAEGDLEYLVVVSPTPTTVFSSVGSCSQPPAVERDVVAIEGKALAAIRANRATQGSPSTWRLV